MKKILAIVVGLSTISGNAFAGGVGTTGANILNIGVGARAISMGEAFTAMADDITSLYWNPAGLALMSQHQASFMYNQNVQDMSFHNAGLGLSLENGGLGTSLSYLTFGDIEGFDDQGNATGNVDASAGVLTLGGGWLFDTFSLGFNMKGVRGALADVKATGVAFDLGGTYVYPYEVLGGSTLRVGTTVKNMGPGMKYLEQTDPFPMEWRTGVALMRVLDKKINLELDYGMMRGQDGSIYAGAEYMLSPFLALRTGYAGTDAEGNGLRAGLGLTIKGITFDYAYAGLGDLGLTHRYELSCKFGEIHPRLTPEERRLLRQAKRAMEQQNYAEAVLLLDTLIKLVPTYRPVHRLYKVALGGIESQEKLAKGQNNFNLVVGNQKPSPTLSDLDDIEQLLSMSDDAIQKSAQAAPGGKK